MNTRLVGFSSPITPHTTAVSVDLFVSDDDVTGLGCGIMKIRFKPTQTQLFRTQIFPQLRKSARALFRSPCWDVRRPLSDKKIKHNWTQTP